MPRTTLPACMLGWDVFQRRMGEGGRSWQGGAGTSVIRSTQIMYSHSHSTPSLSTPCDAKRAKSHHRSSYKSGKHCAKGSLPCLLSWCSVRETRCLADAKGALHTAHTMPFLWPVLSVMPLPPPPPSFLAAAFSWFFCRLIWLFSPLPPPIFNTHAPKVVRVVLFRLISSHAHAHSR